MTRKSITYYLLALAPALLLTACNHKELYMDNPMSSRLEVVFDWRNAPEATPASMALYLYDSDGAEPLRYIFGDRHGGEIKAPFGLRHAICVNADNTDWACLRRHESIETFEIYTLDAESTLGQRLDTKSLPRSEGTESERMAQTPGMLWGSRENNIHVRPHEGTDTITLYPSEAICHYMVDIYDVDNIDGLRSSTVDATLSGMAEGYCFGAASSTETPVTMTFKLTERTADGEPTLHGEFLTFGECPAHNDKHTLTVYMVLNDGSKWWQTYDVTDQVSQAPDPHHVHIIIRGLHLPEPPQEGQPELDVNVNDWQTVEINMQM